MNLDTKTKAILGLGIVLLASLVYNAILVVKSTHTSSLGANSQYGMPCIYTSSTRSLSDGTGTAYSCDISGNLIMSN